MATQNTKSATNDMKSAANDIQSMFDPQGYQNVFKTWASMNERMTSIIVEAGTRSINIMSDTAKKSLSNLSEATQVRDEPADYSRAYSDFAQKQMNLLQRSAQDVGDVTKEAGTEATELASKAGEKLSDEVAANAKDAADKADKAGSATKKVSKASEDAAEKAAANAKDAADKANVNAKDEAEKVNSAAKKAGEDAADKAGSTAKKAS